MMRVAWTGVIGNGSGANALGRAIATGLLSQGVEVDLFYNGPVEGLSDDVRERLNGEIIETDLGWRYDRWYSRSDGTKLMSGMLARVASHWLMAIKLLLRHRKRPYDCIFQFSQAELLLLGRLRRWLPPIVVHPCSHAAGELRWHRAEQELALSVESRWRHFAARVLYIYRSRRQKQELAKSSMIIGPSQMFNELVASDYELDMGRFRMIRHPVDLDRFEEKPQDSPSSSRRPLRLIYVSRLAVRKGAEMVIDLSHRLADLEGEVEILVIGGWSLWSNYAPLLERANTKVLSYEGTLAGGDVVAAYHRADCLLMPSKYEPGSLVVGEALACGLPVVASDAVGPTEAVDPRCCRVFASGDNGALETAVRGLLNDLWLGSGPEIAKIARAEAERLFAQDKIGSAFTAALKDAADGAVSRS